MAEVISTRPICEVAREIQKEWTNVNFAAAPYLSAMFSLNSINDNYLMDSAKSIILYFLCNASSFRGESAKRLKKELKSIANIK